MRRAQPAGECTSRLGDRVDDLCVKAQTGGGVGGDSPAREGAKEVVATGHHETRAPDIAEEGTVMPGGRAASLLLALAAMKM